MAKHWYTLVDSVTKFLEITQGKGTVSIIRFNHKSKILFENTPITPAIAEFLEFHNGMTDFNLPLLQGLDILTKYENARTPFKFIFMSDGYAEYPKEAIRKLIDSKISFQFWAIAFGSLNPQLTKMAQKLKGHTLTAMTEEVLKETYAKIGYEILKPTV